MRNRNGSEIRRNHLIFNVKNDAIFVAIVVLQNNNNIEVRGFMHVIVEVSKSPRRYSTQLVFFYRGITSYSHITSSRADFMHA